MLLRVPRVLVHINSAYGTHKKFMCFTSINTALTEIKRNANLMQQCNLLKFL